MSLSYLWRVVHIISISFSSSDISLIFSRLGVSCNSVARISTRSSLTSSAKNGDASVNNSISIFLESAWYFGLLGDFYIAQAIKKLENLWFSWTLAFSTIVNLPTLQINYISNACIWLYRNPICYRILHTKRVGFGRPTTNFFYNSCSCHNLYRKWRIS